MMRAGIILAAGHGTRMKSATPKVMHKVAGLPMLGHVINAMRDGGVENIVVVIQPGADEIRAFAETMGAKTVVQEQQLGTGHAAACAVKGFENKEAYAVIAYGDMPLVRDQTLAAALTTAEGCGLSVTAFHAKDPAAYGRVVLDGEGYLQRIVEYKDASEPQRKIDLCNAGIFALRLSNLERWSAQLDQNNAQNEFYLTDIPTIAKKEGVRCHVLTMSESEAIGVNSRAELARAEEEMQDRLRADFMNEGVTMISPKSVFLSYDTVLEPDVTLEPNIFCGPGVIIHTGAVIHANSYLEGVVVGKGALIGPFARLRPGAVLEENVHIGNFVEVKKSRIETGAKVNHLTYIGDARVGARTNIGAGTITCNYDGYNKSHTDIGADVFIGSDTSLVAPVSVGDGALIGAGSTITRDVPANSLSVTRAPQKDIPGAAEVFRKRKKALKAAKGK